MCWTYVVNWATTSTAPRRRGDALNRTARTICRDPPVGLESLDVKPSQRYAQDADMMMKFHDAYVELINNTTQGQDAYWDPVLAPRAGITDRRWNELRRTVAQAAGAAGPVYEQYGGTFTMRNAAYVTHGVSPVANWDLSLRDPMQLSPETVVSLVEAAVAAAQHEATEAAERERGITGLVAALIRWPATLREAVGPGKAQRTAAGAVGILGQIVVAAIGGALAVGLVAGAVALWGAVF